MKQDPIIMGDIDIVAKLMDNNNRLDYLIWGLMIIFYIKDYNILKH
jgi:hypothetical protein